MSRNKANLVQWLVILEYKDNNNMIEHLSNFKRLVNQLTKVDMEINNELQVILLLSSLPKSWDTLVVTLSNSAPEGKLTMDPSVIAFLVKKQGEWNKVSLLIPRPISLRIRAKMELVDVTRAEICTNLAGDPSHTPRLHVITV